MAKPALKQSNGVFILEVEGSYWAMGPLQAVKKIFKLECKIPASAIKKSKGILKGRLLPQALMKVDPAFKKLRTFVILGTRGEGVTLNGLPLEYQIDLLGEKELHDLVTRENYDINISLYPRVQNLREAINIYRENPEFYAKREEQLGESMGLTASLEDLNDGMDIEITTGVDENGMPVSAQESTGQEGKAGEDKKEVAAPAPVPPVQPEVDPLEDL